MPENEVTVVGSVEKVETFSAKGGGIQLKVQLNDSSHAQTFIDNTQRIADIEFRFRATSSRKSSDDPSQGRLPGTEPEE